MSKRVEKEEVPVYALNGQGGIAPRTLTKPRPQLSTSHQLLRVVEYAKSGFKEKIHRGRFSGYPEGLRSCMAYGLTL
ncbi:hypothetical protein TNCV_1130941 [Trichonephila clavipes]|nr:hypothetical protein TNCV_1130941 [Trichonephila clavipes]